MQSFPLTPNDNARQAVYAKVSPERTIPIVSDAQLGVQAGIQARQQAAAVNPAYNGADARPPGRRQGLGFTKGYSSKPSGWRASEVVGS